MQSRRWLTCFGCLIAVTALTTTPAQAALPDPGLTGTTQFDGWAGLTANNYPGYGGFPGMTPATWTIGSNVAGSGDADLNKIGLGPAGLSGGYPGTDGIYHGGFSDVPNTLGGTESITDTTPVANLKNVVFQLLISEAFGYDLFNDALPILTYNADIPAPLPGFSSKVRVDTGMTFPNPISGDLEPLFHTTRKLQWDLSGIAEPITSIKLTFSPVQHGIILEARLDQSDTFTWVPEPGSLSCIGLVGLVVCRRGYRRRD